jgi:hypothetical protein
MARLFRARIYQQGNRKTGKYLVCTFKHNKKTHTISTGLKVTKDERWNHERQQIHTTNRDKFFLLQQIKVYLTKAIPEFKLTGNKELLKIPIVPTRAMKKEETVLTAIDRYAHDTGKNQLTVKSIANQLKEYRNPKLRRYFSLQDFYKFLLNKGLEVSTANQYCTIINTSVKWVWNEQYKWNKQTAIDKFKWCLLEEEIQTLWKQNPKSKTERKALMMAKGIYYSLQRYSDLLELIEAYQEGDIETGFPISKTRKNHTLQISQKLKEILPEIQFIELRDFNRHIKFVASRAKLNRRVGGRPIHEILRRTYFQEIRRKSFALERY